MRRLLYLLFAALTLAWTSVASAAVTMHFHSFNGSVLFGRYPHTFVVLEGTLEASGQRVEENFGWSAKRVTPAVLSRPVEHMILVEKPRMIGKTNRHFSVRLSDDQYRRIKAMVANWRDQPGAYYDLEKRNCIHFVGEIGRIAGLRIDYPDNMLRRPKEWLNHIATLNPRLGARQID
ncbi:hypothetical protein [Qipengyuania sp. MTN3-11]|uniref:hypothetical protein n=1 Tax=Qipengyuania sp. MTN3-11 TaxID=3056557 RepID=UPI0036F375E0